MRFSICCRCDAGEKKKPADDGNTGPAIAVISTVTEQPKPSEPIQLDRITEVSVEESSVQAVQKEETPPITRSQPEKLSTQLVPPSGQPRDSTYLPNVSQLINPPAGTKINVNCTTKSGKNVIMPFTLIEPGHYHCSYEGKEFTILNEQIHATDGAYNDMDKQTILRNFSMALLGVQQGMLQMQQGVLMGMDKSVQAIPEEETPPSTNVHTGNSKSMMSCTTNIGSQALTLDLIEPGHFIGTFKGKQFTITDGQLQSKDGDYNNLDKELIMNTYSRCMVGMEQGIKGMEAGMAQFGPSMHGQQIDLPLGTPINMNFTTRSGEKAVIPLTFIEPGHFRGKYDGIEFTILNGEIRTDDADDDLVLDKELILMNYHKAIHGMQKGLLGMQQGLLGMSARYNTSQPSHNNAATVQDELSVMRKMIQKSSSGLKSDAVARLLQRIDDIKRANNANAVDKVDGHDMSNIPEPILQKTTFKPNAIFYEDPKKYGELDKDEIPPAKRLDEFIISLDESVKAGNRYYFHAAKPRRVTRRDLTPREHFQIASPERYSLFQKECLKVHNEYRKLHGVPPLAHSEFLCQVAKEWAEHLALKDAFYHRPNNDYGENLYRVVDQPVSARKAVAAWYDEIDIYDYDNPTFSKETGHFTQLVWKDTLEMGTGVAQLGNKVWVCCNYNPQGNYLDSFNEEFIPRPIVKRVPKL